MQAEYATTVEELLAAARERFGNRLVSAVLYGSVARGEARTDSDIDLLLVVRDLPSGRRARGRLLAVDIDRIEAPLRRERPHAWVQLVMKTPDEVEMGGPLFYDMTLPGGAELLHDPASFMRSFLDRLRGKMEALGARRMMMLGHPYWDLKPDFAPGDVVDL